MSKAPDLTIDGPPQAVALSERVHWVGELDPNLRIFDIILKTANGTSYNAYIVRGSEGVAVIDTVKESYADDFFARLESDDFPSPWRLACQVIVRDEDILVEY